jgi:hypothetical protein
LLEYWTDGNYKDKVSIAALRERLKNQIPRRRNIEIIAKQRCKPSGEPYIPEVITPAV